MKKKMMMIAVIIMIVALSSIICVQKVSAFFIDSDAIYKEPDIVPNQDREEGLDDMIKDAQKFENKQGAVVGSESGINGNQSQAFEINSDSLQYFSSNLVNILLISATVVSVFIGTYIGIKYMTGSVQEKADYKKMLVPYVAGCVAIYGALGIWKMVVTILGVV